jgi:hypothetical protein
MLENFWQINFWGVVGTVTGLGGLLISYLNWRYSKPFIEIMELTLVAPKNTYYIGKSAKELANYNIEYTLHISFRNKKGGSGSIEKPKLIIQIPGEQFSLSPQTQHIESRSINSNTSESWVVRHGKSWNLDGGESGDDELTYHSRSAEDNLRIMNAPFREYYIEYRDNSGKRLKEKIFKIEER